MGQIRVTDEVVKQLKEISDGRSMSATIQKLLDNKSNNDEFRQIKDRLSNIEAAIRDIRVPASEPQQLQPVVLTPFPEQMTRQEASYDTQSPTPSVSDRTVDEIFEEVNQIMKELKTLDKDDPKRKELENRLRADNAELALLGDN